MIINLEDCIVPIDHTYKTRYPNNRRQYREPPKKHERSGSLTNPCGECQRNVADCPWLSSRGREPVPGWEAEAITRRIGHQDAPTYHISSCPLYIAPRRAVIPESAPDSKRHHEYTGFCVLCGAPLTGGQRKYCTDCRKKYSGHV